MRGLWHRRWELPEGSWIRFCKKSLSVSKRVRNETAIGQCAVSVPYAAVELAKQIFGTLDERKILLMGAGKMSELSARYLKKYGATDVRVINRTLENAQGTGKETAMLMMAFACEGIYDEQDHAAMTVLRAILNGYSTPGGWLHNELRGEGLIYYIFTHEMTGPVPGYFVITSQPRADKLDEVVQRVRADLEKAKRGEISDAEYRLAIDQIVGLHAQENVTIAEQARTAAVDELLGLGYDYDTKFDAQILA